MWDAIVIGSGIGGLAAAAALGRRGARVLVLEQHHQVGGQTQVFSRGDWSFATGVHYLGGVGPMAGPEGQFGRTLSWLTGGELRFAPLANPYDVVRWPGFSFGIEHPEVAFRDALRERFPDCRQTIDHWFTACEEARASAYTLMAMHAMPKWLAAGLRLVKGAQAERWAHRTLADELARIADPALRAVLGARWGDHGAPPAQAPFVEHALVMGAYNGGAYYPVGGPARFAQTLRVPVEAAGGEIRCNAAVTAIEVRNGRVAGVTVRQGDGTLHEAAAHVVSDMGALNTAAALPDGVADDWRARLRCIGPGAGFVALYIGLEGDIAAAGATSANGWIFDQPHDIDRLWRRPAEEDAPGLFVSFPSLKDPASSGAPTAELIALVDHEAFAPFLDGGDAAARHPGYLAFKAAIEQRLLAQFGRWFPALAPMVRFHELATPLTQRRMVHTPDGAMYGLEMTGERLVNPALHLRTPVPGLYLAGQDVAGPGVPAAFMAGLMAAAAVDAGVWREMGR